MVEKEEKDTDGGYEIVSETLSNKPNPKVLKQNEIWLEWLKSQIKTCKSIEIVILVMLSLILLNSYTTRPRDKEIIDLINKIENRYENMEKSIEVILAKLEGGIYSKKKNSKTEEYSNAKTETFESKSKEEHLTSPKQPEMHNNSPFEFNAANFLFGASVDTSRSSSSNLSPLIGRDQSGLVLIDRANPPVDKTWCSSDLEPILTVNLAKYIKPTAISYQHFKWNGAVPDGAPKSYSVVACLDFSCEKTKLLANCQYKATSDSKQEQSCQIPPHLELPLIVKVQFKFQKNHGNVKETCISLIRVYGESKVAPIVEPKTLKNAKECSILASAYYNNPISYNIRRKNCETLYSQGCCDECPECCEECLITDINGENVFFSVVFTFFGFILLLFIFCFIITLPLLFKEILTGKAREEQRKRAR